MAMRRKRNPLRGLNNTKTFGAMTEKDIQNINLEGINFGSLINGSKPKSMSEFLNMLRGMKQNAKTYGATTKREMKNLGRYGSK